MQQNLYCSMKPLLLLLLLLHAPSPSSSSGGTSFATVSPSLFDVTSLGAVGDGTHDDSQAFLAAWQAACLVESATIYVPGQYSFYVGPMIFSGPCKPNLVFQINGAIVAPNDPDAWALIQKPVWLGFDNLKNFTLAGTGVIDGKGQKWWAQSCKANLNENCRTKAPTSVVITDSENIEVRDLTLKDSQQMHLSFSNCSSVVATGLQIIAPAKSPNTDGIHLSACSGILIEDCEIGTGDDCISIQSGTSDVSIKGGVCGPGHGVSIGGLGPRNSFACVSDVTVDGLIVNAADNGVRIKSWQGGHGAAYRIKFQNVRMIDVKNPIIVTQFYCDQTTPCQNQTSAVSIHDITFSNITGTSLSPMAVTIACSDVTPCSGIRMANVQFQLSASAAPAQSFCWNAKGGSYGLMQPSSCLLIDQQLPSSSSALEEFLNPTSTTPVACSALP